MAHFIIDHEGPRQFVVYRIDNGNYNKIDTFKTNHSAKKFVASQNGEVTIADDKKRVKRKVGEDGVPDIVSHCGKSTTSIWRQAQASNSRKKAIRAMCLMCVGGSAKEVRLCSSTDCPLHKFRITG